MERIDARTAATLLGSEPGEPFDRITRIASELLRAPVVLVSMLDAERDRIVFKSAVGLGEPYATLRSVPTAQTLCQHVIRSGRLLSVEDARLDPALRGSEAVAGTDVVAYLGVPLEWDRRVLGTLCVIDHEARAWTTEEIRGLEDLAHLVLLQIELCLLRSRSTELEDEQRALTRRMVSESATVSERDAQARVMRVLESVSDGFVFLDNDWRYTYANRRAAEIVGRSAEELIGKRLLEVFPEIVGNATHQAMERAARTQVSTQVQEYAPWLKVWFETRILPSRDGLAIFFQDVTERKLVERSAAQAERFAVLGRIASGVAHDFNNVLAVILASAAAPGLQARPEIAEIRSAAERGAALARQLLAFGPARPAEARPWQVGEVVRELVPLLTRLVGPDVALTIDADDRGSVTIERSRLEQIVMNLVINARDACEASGTVAVRVHEVTLAVPLVRFGLTAQPGRYVRLSVHDRGCGFSEDALENVFQPFFTTKGEGSGTGLGLATVYAAVRQVRGAVEVITAPREGSEIAVHLPVDPTTSA